MLVMMVIVAPEKAEEEPGATTNRSKRQEAGNEVVQEKSDCEPNGSANDQDQHL